MKTPSAIRTGGCLIIGIGFASCLITAHSLLLFSATADPLWSRAERETPAFLQTLNGLVSIESGSRDREGLDRLSTLIAAQLKDLGGKVEFVEPGADTY